MFNSLRETPDAPSEFISCEVREVIASADAEDGRPTTMKRWEYAWTHEEATDLNRAMKKVWETANTWGADGWEMVSWSTEVWDQRNVNATTGRSVNPGHSHVLAFFKRPRAD